MRWLNAFYVNANIWKQFSIICRALRLDGAEKRFDMLIGVYSEALPGNREWKWKFVDVWVENGKESCSSKATPRSLLKIPGRTDPARSPRKLHKLYCAKHKGMRMQNGKESFMDLWLKNAFPTRGLVRERNAITGSRTPSKGPDKDPFWIFIKVFRGNKVASGEIYLQQFSFRNSFSHKQHTDPICIQLRHQTESSFVAVHLTFYYAASDENQFAGVKLD